MYWRRRVVVLAVVLLGVLLLAKACGGDGAQAVRQTTPATTTSPRPTATVGKAQASAAAKPAAACEPGAIQVTATTDAATYPTGALPRLTMHVTNTTGRACSVVVSEAARHFTVMSGQDRVWSTDDCKQPKGVVRTTLRPGATIAYARTWDRHRSVEGCASPGDPAGPGTYRFVAGLGDAQSVEVVFHLRGESS